MLTHPTLEKLQALRLTGMLKGLEEQLQMTGLEELSFAECRISRSSAAVFSEFSVAVEGGMCCGPGFDRWRLNPGLD
jgi:hypothetical protein